jgi:CTP:molybdopterin cytidylyltransferase MocA
MLRMVTAATVVSCALAIAAAGEGTMPQTKVLSRAETETLVKKDLAARLRVPVDEITVAEAADRTWPGNTLECVARKGMKEPKPVEGFALTLTHADKRFEYRSDRHGHFRRCETKRRVEPIKR